MARKSKYAEPSVFGILPDAAWKAAIYLRLSVEDGDDVEQNSIGNQKKICLAYLEDKKDINVVDIYMDHGFSGMNYKRPGFAEMNDAITNGLVNCIIVKDVSRFGREYITTSEFLQRTFPSMGVRFISINDDYDSERPNSDVEGLLLPFKMIINDSYAKDTSKKIRSSITAKMNSGEYLPSSGSIPYGYFRNPEENIFDIDPEAASVVKRIFNLRAEGLPFNTIAKRLNDEGIPSPGRLRFLRGISKDKRFADSDWTRGTIRKITNDPVYIGNRIHGKVKRDRLGENKTRRDMSEWRIIPGSHPAIIPVELFYAVKEVNKAELERRSQFNDRGKPEDDYRSVLRDKLFCGDCGTRMIALKRNQRLTSELPPVVIYQCNAYQYSDLKKCSNHYINEPMIISTLKSVIDHQLEVAADIEKAIQSASRASKATRKEKKADSLQSIRVRRRNIEAKQERLLMDLTNGILNREEYEYTKARYAKEREALLSEEREAEKKTLSMKETYNTAQKWLNSLRQYRRLPMLNKEIVDIIVDKIFVFSDKRIQISLNYKDPYKEFAPLLGETEVTKDAG